MFTMEVSPIVGEFCVVNNKLRPHNRRPKLKDKKTALETIDLVRGFDSERDIQTNHGIHHLFDYLETTNFFSKDWKTRDEFEETEYTFTMGRYVLTQIEKFAKGSDDFFEILAFRKDDTVYFGSNRSITEGRVCTEYHKLAAYAGLQFGRMMTKDTNSHSLRDTHSIVRKIRVYDNTANRAHTLIVSSTVRAFDRDGSTPIEIHLKKATKNLQFCVDQWSFSALLAGSNKIMYGSRNEAFKVTRVSLIRHLKEKHEAALKMINSMLTEVAKIIENQKCIVIKPSSTIKRTLSFEKTDVSYMEKSDQW